MHIITSIFDKELVTRLAKLKEKGIFDFYVRKFENNSILFLYPNENEFFTYASILTLSNNIVLSTRNIDQIFGEVLIGSILLNKKIIFTDDNDISNLLGDFKNYSIVKESDLLNEIIKVENKKESEKRIDIDRSFIVKGVGTVSIGIVTKGSIALHDKLYLEDKEIEIKSIQIEDVNENIAETNSWVGLALKGIEADFLERGSILKDSAYKKRKEAKIKIKKLDFLKEKIEVNKTYTLVSNFIKTDCSIKEIDNDIITLNIKREIPIEKGDKILLLRNTIPRIFASGEVL